MTGSGVIRRHIVAELLLDYVTRVTSTGIYTPWDVEEWKEAVAIRRELERLLVT